MLPVLCVDIVGDVINNLSVPRSRRKLVEKIMELGLVGDRRELRRKRQKKDGSTNNSKHRQKNNDDFTELADLMSDEHSSSESNAFIARHKQQTCVTVAMVMSID